MYAAHQKQLELLTGKIQAALEGGDSDRLHVCVLSGTGHGDHMRGLAFAKAVKRAHQGCHLTFIWHYCGAAGAVVDLDLVHAAVQAGVVDAHVPINEIPREVLVNRLCQEFDVTYDAVPYAVAAYWHAREGWHALQQAHGDKCLKPFMDLYAGHPFSRWTLKQKALTVWEIMSESTGIEVSEDDLIPPTDCAEIPDDFALAAPEGVAIDPKATQDELIAAAGKGKWKQARVVGCRYVVIHPAAGSQSNVKVASIETWKAVISQLQADGIKCVQVGSPHNVLVKGALNRRGVRVPLVARLIQGSLGVVCVEGFMDKLALACGVRSTVLFGPTLPALYASPRNLNLIAVDKTGHPPCAIGTCYWGGGVFPPFDWARRCGLGMYDKKMAPAGNPQFPHCCNFVPPHVAARAAGEMVKAAEVGATDGEAQAPQADAG